MSVARWREVKTSEYMCPHCGYTKEFLIIRKDGKIKCPNCDIASSEKKWKSVEIRRPSARCEDCGINVPFNDDNRGIAINFAFLCPKCNKALAIDYEGKQLTPQEVMNVSWNDTLRQRKIGESSNLSFTLSTEDKDILILELMQHGAMEESPDFRFFKERDQLAFLVFTEDSYIGYAIWSEEKDGLLTLRQFYVLPEWRGKGFGTAIIKFWAEKYGLNQRSYYRVESPTDVTKMILIKLGHVKQIAQNKIQLIRCAFVHGF